MKDSSEFETGALSQNFFFIYEGFIWACEQNKQSLPIETGKVCPYVPAENNKGSPREGSFSQGEGKMKRLLTSIIAVSLFAIQPALAEEAKDSNLAKYGVSISTSPFGGSVNFSYNSCSKTSWQFSFGGSPELGLLTIDVNGTDSKVKSSSSWAGAFINHRPLESAKWFRLVAGLGIGSINHKVTSGDKEFRVRYSENPVAYLGLGVGGSNQKGFMWAFDVGYLATGGPDVSQESGDADAAALKDIEENLLFGNALPNAQLSLGWNF